MNATIIYRLSQAGQKASILSGGSAEQEQKIIVPSDAPEFASVVEAAKLDSAGNVVLQTHGAQWPGQYLSFDSPQTAASIVSVLADRKAAADREHEEKLAKRTADTLATISERKKSKHSDTVSVVEDGLRRRIGSQVRDCRMAL